MKGIINQLPKSVKTFMLPTVKEEEPRRLTKQMTFIPTTQAESAPMLVRRTRSSENMLVDASGVLVPNAPVRHCDREASSTTGAAPQQISSGSESVLATALVPRSNSN